MPSADVQRYGPLKASANLAKGHVPIGSGLFVYREHTVTATITELGIDVELLVVYDQHARRLVVDTFQAERRKGGSPITGEVLRRIPIASIVSRAVGMLALHEVEPGKLQPVGVAQLADEDESHYVARIYRMAHVSGYPTTKAVQEALGIAESTATQKVVLARKLKLLPKTEPGKARA